MLWALGQCLVGLLGNPGLGVRAGAGGGRRVGISCNDGRADDCAFPHYMYMYVYWKVLTEFDITLLLTLLCSLSTFVCIVSLCDIDKITLMNVP